MNGVINNNIPNKNYKVSHFQKFIGHFIGLINDNNFNFQLTFTFIWLSLLMSEVTFLAIFDKFVEPMAFVDPAINETIRFMYKSEIAHYRNFRLRLHRIKKKYLTASIKKKNSSPNCKG